MSGIRTFEDAAYVTPPRRRGIRRWGDACRRMMDILIASAALIYLSPVMLGIAIAIYLEDGAPILFSQTRLGVDGKPFKLLKFRKFWADAGSAGLPVTLTDDPRLTRVGRFLEKTKLDELPQFWNILVGDMSVVGPRPESLHFADCFVGSFRGLLLYRPGLFGPAQVKFRNESAYYQAGEDPERIYRETLFPAKASMDLPYYENRSLLRDLGWICQGVAAVADLRRRRPVRGLAVSSDALEAAPAETDPFVEAELHGLPSPQIAGI